MTIRILQLDGFHTAYLDAMTGSGLLVMPRPEHDVWLGPESVQLSAWNAAMRKLVSMGWEPNEDDETGLLVHEGTTAGGFPVIALSARDSIVSRPSMRQYAEAWAKLKTASGVDCSRR